MTMLRHTDRDQCIDVNLEGQSILAHSNSLFSTSHILNNRTKQLLFDFNHSSHI